MMTFALVLISKNNVIVLLTDVRHTALHGIPSRLAIGNVGYAGLFSCFKDRLQVLGDSAKCGMTNNFWTFFRGFYVLKTQSPKGTINPKKLI